MEIQLDTVHFSVMKAVRTKPEQHFVGLFAKIKDELLKACLIVYEGNSKYVLTDLGHSFLEESR